MKAVSEHVRELFSHSAGQLEKYNNIQADLKVAAVGDEEDDMRRVI